MHLLRRLPAVAHGDLACDWESYDCNWSISGWQHQIDGPSAEVSAHTGDGFLYSRTDAVLMSAQIQPEQGEWTLKFHYYLRSTPPGKIIVSCFDNVTSSWSVIWSIEGDHGAAWHDANLIIPASTTVVRVLADRIQSSDVVALDSFATRSQAVLAQPPEFLRLTMRQRYWG